jgi:hypothetical protein
MKTFKIILLSCGISIPLSIGGSYLITVNIIKQDIEQSVVQKVIGGNIVLEGGSSIGHFQGNKVGP